ncbi:MAG TPA: TRAM domain-containing protein [Vicinamibacterales bacterium]|nr:TRAM domain-containing protein [Vicinamibacterales bacterium]
MLLTLDIEKATAGGRMLARHQGQVVLVSGAIPGERVSARLERTGKGVAFAEVVEVLSPSADRRSVAADARCGGNVLAHVNYARQLRLKGEIIQDALGRIGRMPIPAPPDVIGSPERGYRMRARFHVQGWRIGYYLEGTHRLCDAAATGQLLAATADWIAAAERTLASARFTGVSAIELAENVAGDERACHLELVAGADPRPLAALSEGLSGLSAQRADRADVVRIAGTPAVTDVVRVSHVDAPIVRLRRDVRSFFQGNRFLLEPLVRCVAGLVEQGPVIDLYAGVGLFGLSLAAAGRDPVTLVEADPVSGADLQHNAEPFAPRVTVARRKVETFLAEARRSDAADATVIVDPPRTGLSKEAAADIIRLSPPQIVYVSCDVATFARDTRTLADAGYRLDSLKGIDLFPNTAHVETIASFTR